MAHDHAIGTLNYGRAFALGVGLNVVFIVTEVVAGLWVDSVALLADAGHNLGDVIGLLLAWGGHWLSHRPTSKRYTYGLRGSTILAALFNALLLLAAVGAITWEAVQRLTNPPPVAAGIVMLVAGIGVVINLATALLFLKGRREDLNVRGAFLHLAADAAVSLGVVLGGILILLTGWELIDPVMSLLIAVVIFLSTWGLLRESVNLAVQAVPADIDLDDVAAYLRNRPGVTDVHDLHVWAISTTENALTAHLIRPKPDGDPDGFLAETATELCERFRIGHATLQLECGLRPEFCPQSQPGAV